jgi:hypothetical protein
VTSILEQLISDQIVDIQPPKRSPLDDLMNWKPEAPPPMGHPRMPAKELSTPVNSGNSILDSLMNIKT